MARNAEIPTARTIPIVPMIEFISFIEMRPNRDDRHTVRLMPPAYVKPYLSPADDERAKTPPPPSAAAVSRLATGPRLGGSRLFLAAK
jgi:hypothetical protein